MSDERLPETDRSGASERRTAEPGTRAYGRAIDCAARAMPAERHVASGHGRGAPQPGTMDEHVLRG